MAKVPTYELYGEENRKSADFWLHCETLFSRSSLHRFEIGLHRHESFFQILYIQDGTGDASLDGSVFSIQPPAIITVPPFFEHGFRFSRDINGLVVTVLLSHLPVRPAEHGRIGEWLSRPRLTNLPAGADADYLGATIRRIAEEFEAGRSGKSNLLEAYLTSAIMLTARLSMLEEQNERFPADGAQARLEQLSSLLNQHFRAQRPVAFYAAQLGISTTHLNRIVKAATGITTQELISRKVIDAACRDLVFTSATVQGIGFNLGFSDPAYFSRFFQRETGMTPRSYRQAERARLSVTEENS